MPEMSRMDTVRKLISDLERKRNSRIFSIIQCGDSHPDNEICNCTLNRILASHAELNRVPVLEVLLNSPGGDADVAYSVMRYFRRRCTRLNVIVPMSAKSAATLMTLGADAIYMGQFSDLGPIDVQMTDPLKRGDKAISPLDELKSTEFLRDYAVELLDSFTMLILGRSGMSIKEAIHEAVPFTTQIMRPLYEKLDPIEIGEHRRSLAIGEEYAKRLLETTKNPRQREIVKALVSKYPSHSFVIDAEEARSLGLPVLRLQDAEEDMFLEVINCVNKSDGAFYGFAQEPGSKPAVRTKRKVGASKRKGASVAEPIAITAKKRSGL